MQKTSVIVNGNHYLTMLALFIFSGETVLHVAAINGDYHLAMTSIEKGVSIHARDYCGWQPLHEACNYGNLAVVELLLDSGADIDDPGGPHCRGMTPLHDAVQNGHVDVVKLLISRGASMTRRNNDGHTPLGLALHFIQEDEDDDDSNDLDPDLAEIREDLTRILRNATNTGKRQQTKVPELRRRDKLEFSDDSDVELSQDFSENVSKKTEEISRKRKSGLLELDSDEENTPRNSMNVNGNKAKVAKVSKNTERVSWLDDESQNRYDGTILESQDRMSETSGRGTFRGDSDHSETSRDSIGDLEVLRSDSRNSEDVIELDSDPLDALCSPQPCLFDYSDPLDIPQVPCRTPKSGRTRMFQLRLSSNKNNASSSSSSKNNTTSSVLRISNTISRTNSATPRKSNNTIPRTVSRTANTISRSANTTGYVDPVTGSTQEDTQTPESQPALIPENEYLATATDAWLIDDMPKKTGKRKRSGNLLSLLSGSESSRDNSASSRMRGSSDSSRSVSSNSGTQRRVPQASTQRGHTTSTGGNKHRLRQSRLNVVSGRSSPNEFWDDAPSEPTSLSSSVTTVPMRLRVRVKDKMFLIPCPNVPGERKTVKWLAEQV